MRYLFTILLVIIALAASAVYVLALNLLNQLPFKKLETEIDFIQILFAFVFYLLFSYDYLKLYRVYTETYTTIEQRFWLQAGTVVGSMVFKIGMGALWYCILQSPISIVVAIIYASILTLKVARLRIKDIEETASPLLQKLKAGAELFLLPINRLFDKISSSTVYSPHLNITRNLTNRALCIAALTIPIATIHDFVGFVAFYHNFSILNFGIGIILSNLVLNILLSASPTNKLFSLSKHSLAIIFSTIFFLSLLIFNGNNIVNIVAAF